MSVSRIYFSFLIEGVHIWRNDSANRELQHIFLIIDMTLESMLMVEHTENKFNDL